VADVDEPADTLVEPVELLLGYLDYYRDSVRRKVTGMAESELRISRLPSGWAPLELVSHLAFMERRWMRWGFAGEAVSEPWGDDDPVSGRWRVAPDRSLADVLEQLQSTGAQTRATVAMAQLDDPARTGGRFSTDRRPPALSWILFHVLSEYARHLGHLDVARELADGEVGE
jgi:Protein of unknown function (DUF664)